MRPGFVSSTTESRRPAIRSAFSRSSGYTLNPFGRTMMSRFRPDRIRRPAASRWPMSPVFVPAVVGVRRGRLLGRVPVALEQRRAAELDLAVVGQPHLDARRRAAHGAQAVILEGRGRTRAGLGRAVALEDGDAHVLPGLLQRGREECAGRHEDPERTPELRMDLPEQDAACRHRQATPDRPEPVEQRSPAGLLDLALDRAPEQVEHLGHDDHRRDAMRAERIEDHPRVAAPDVQDARPDRQRVVQAHRLLEQVRQREQRHDPVLHRRDDPVEGLVRGEEVVVREHHALRRAGRARGEDQLDEVARLGAWPGGDLGLPVRRERGRADRVASGGPPIVSTVVVAKLPSPNSAGSGASCPVPTIRCFAPDARTMPSIASVDMRRSSGTRTMPARIAPRYVAGSSGVDGDQVRSRSPGLRPSARRR